MIGQSVAVSFGGGFQTLACTRCELVVSEWCGLCEMELRVQRLPAGERFVHFEADELEFEHLEVPAARVTHLPTGIGVEADVRDTVGGNERVALQAIALQIRDRREREAAW